MSRFLAQGERGGYERRQNGSGNRGGRIANDYGRVARESRKGYGVPEDVGQIALRLLEDVRKEQTRIADLFEAKGQRIDEINRKLDEHAAESNRRHEQILNAFPASDIDGHRRYHEAIIKRIELRNEIVLECLKKTAQVGVLAGLLWLGKAILASMVKG